MYRIKQQRVNDLKLSVRYKFMNGNGIWENEYLELNRNKGKDPTDNRIY